MESVEDSNVCFQECSSGGLICSCHKPSRWNTYQFQGTLADKVQAFLKKAEVGELEVSLIVCPIPWTLTEQYFHPFHPKLEVSRCKGCIHANILAMVLSFCKKALRSQNGEREVSQWCFL